MKRLPWIVAGSLLLGCGIVFAIGAVEQAMKSKIELTAWMPEGALLSIEARDFGALLHDWSVSPEKRSWLTSDNYADFSRSHLYTRLSQAQDEFSAAAGLPTNSSLLQNVAGKESCLSLYDIGNLEFLYITHLDQQSIESTQLWQTRSKFEQRNEAGSVFFVHKDAQSSRTAAFASKDGWLILGTREDLVAGALGRMAGVVSHNLSNEEWYARAIEQASAERGDLRMTLNLAKIVPSLYFRSYWVQRNITEMKQYASAVSDLYRSRDTYREQRVLLRRTGSATAPSADVNALAAMVPEDAVFYVARVSLGTEDTMRSLRENLLEVKSAQSRGVDRFAPTAATSDMAGAADQFDVRIDQAPVTAPITDAFQPLRALLDVQQPEAVLQVYSSRSSSDAVFVSMQTAMALTSAKDWDADAVHRALTAAILPGLTAGNLGADWQKGNSADGDYFALSGTIPIFVAAEGKQLLVANDASLLKKLMARRHNLPSGSEPITYSALYRSAQDRKGFLALMSHLDLAGHRGTSDKPSGSDQAPAFFSGNLASLQRVFAGLDSERVQEQDQGARVLQTVIYQWAN